MEAFLNLNDVVCNHYFLLGGVFLVYLVYRILHSLVSDNNYMRTRYRSRGHTWRSIQCNKSVPYNIYCTNCGKLMLATVGLFCECCAVSACKRCHRVIDKKFRCKPVTWPGDKPFYHQWVHVGTTETETVDQQEEGLRRYFCSWCQRTKLWAHSLATDNEHCDFQKYRNIIIPPACVQLEKGVISNIKHPGDNDWEPFIILANPKSGSNRSDEVLSLFRGLLNPIQVVDISSTSPESVVRWLPPRCRILVAGGDGTVAWVMNSLFSFSHLREAAVAILPMGTGNDLSRVLGWGAGGHTTLDAHNIINTVRQAIPQPLDRWKVTIIPKRNRLIRYRQPRVLYAYNYASIGVDAQVALDFHHARAQFLYRYASRTLNYMAYLLLGAGRALDAGGCGGLERRLRVTLGGAAHALALPPLQALVALNIPSWGAGVDLWSMGNEGDVNEQSIHDGKLEVVGISSSFHIARLQVGLAEPYRFAQASSLKSIGQQGKSVISTIVLDTGSSRSRSPSARARSRCRSTSARSRSRHLSPRTRSRSRHQSPRCWSRSPLTQARSRSPSVQCHTPSPSRHITQQPDNHNIGEPSNIQDLEISQVLVDKTPETAPNDTELNGQQQEIGHIEIDTDIISAMGAVEEEPVNGPPAHNEIVQRWTPILSKGLKKEDKAMLLKEYTPFHNIPAMVPPRLNPELSAAVSEPVKKRDIIIEYRQKNIAAALAAVGRGLENFMFYNKVDGIKRFNDAAKILCELLHSETQSRRALIVSVINKELKDSLQGSPDAFLFGEGLTERIKVAKAVQRSAQDLVTTTAVAKQNNVRNQRPLNSRAPPQPGNRRLGFNKMKTENQQGGGGKKAYSQKKMRRPPQQQRERTYNPRK